MTIQYQGIVATFGETASVEDAEALLEWVQRTPEGTADFSGCTHIHAADLQVLMAARLPVANWPRDASFKAWLMAALDN
jgi:hypothetical protein